MLISLFFSTIVKLRDATRREESIFLFNHEKKFRWFESWYLIKCSIRKNFILMSIVTRLECRSDLLFSLHRGLLSIGSTLFISYPWREKWTKLAVQKERAERFKWWWWSKRWVEKICYSRYLFLWSLFLNPPPKKKQLQYFCNYNS